jgi:hypothetical protein
MLVAYLSTDEVNLTLAAELAGKQGIALRHLEPRDGLPGAEFDAVLCDWDYWHVTGRAGLLAALSGGAAGRPVALHSFHVEPDQVEALRRGGVVLHPRLRAKVFQQLRQAVLAARSDAAVGAPKPTPLTGEVDNAA